MKPSIKILLLLQTFYGVLAACPDYGFAFNSALTIPRVKKLQQEGQNVKILLSIHDFTYNLYDEIAETDMLDKEYSVLRWLPDAYTYHDPDGKTYVIGPRNFNEKEACFNTYPGERYGVPWPSEYIFRIIDYCVTPGEYFYQVESYSDYGPLGEGGKWITVKNIDDACEPADATISETCDPPYERKFPEDDTGDDEAGCGCSFASGDPAGILTAAMLLLAFFALMLDRARRK